MSSKFNLFNSGIWCLRVLFAVFISALLLVGSDWPSSDRGMVSADFFEWNAKRSPPGGYSYLRELPRYQSNSVFGDKFSFYATKSILVFGEGQVMLIDWLPQDTIGRKFKIKFSYLDKDDVDEIVAASDTNARNILIDMKTATSLNQTTAAVFDGQAGVYSRVGEVARSLAMILMGAPPRL